jgi:hypothetical protein
VLRKRDAVVAQHRTKWILKGGRGEVETRNMEERRDSASSSKTRGDKPSAPCTITTIGGVEETDGKELDAEDGDDEEAAEEDGEESLNTELEAVDPRNNPFASVRVPADSDSL